MLCIPCLYTMYMLWYVYYSDVTASLGICLSRHVGGGASTINVHINTFYPDHTTHQTNQQTLRTHSAEVIPHPPATGCHEVWDNTLHCWVQFSLLEFLFCNSDCDIDLHPTYQSLYSWIDNKEFLGNIWNDQKGLLSFSVHKLQDKTLTVLHSC